MILQGFRLPVEQGMRESNPHQKFWRLLSYHLTNPLYCKKRHKAFGCTFKTTHKYLISFHLLVPITYWLCPRPISNSQLHALLHFHLCPIYLVFFKGSWISHLEGGFTLRCLQRLSRPGLATLPCSW